MAVDFDNAARAALAAFAEAVAYTPQGGEAVSLDAVFDQPFREVEMLAGPPVTSQVPAVTIRLADLAVVPAQGDSLVARSQTFLVREVRLDGQGMARLLLNLA